MVTVLALATCLLKNSVLTDQLPWADTLKFTKSDKSLTLRLEFLIVSYYSYDKYSRTWLLDNFVWGSFSYIIGHKKKNGDRERGKNDSTFEDLSTYLQVFSKKTKKNKVN